MTSSLMKDMNSKIDLYRSNAIRVLCNITDSGLLGQIERYLKQAVVDKNAVVSSAALVSGIHLLKVSGMAVRETTSQAFVFDKATLDCTATVCPCLAWTGLEVACV